MSLLFAAAFLVGAAGGWHEASALRRHGVLAQGEVVAVHGGKYGYVTVAFTTAAGRRVEAHLRRFDWGSRPEPLDLVPVLYDSRDEQRAVDAREGPDWFAPCGLGAMGLVFLAVFVLQVSGRFDWRLRS